MRQSDDVMSGRSLIQNHLLSSNFWEVKSINRATDDETLDVWLLSWYILMSHMRNMIIFVDVNKEGHVSQGKWWILYSHILMSIAINC